MTGSWFKASLLAAIVLWVSSASAGAASAASTVTAQAPLFPVRNVLILAGDASDNESTVVQINGSTKTFAVASYDGLTSVAPCEQESAVLATCPVLGSRVGVGLFEGDDSLRLSIPGSSSVTAGEGSDFVRGGPGRDEVDGGEGDDVVRSAGGRDTLAGSDGRDRLRSGADADRVFGDRGSDSFDAGGGSDFIDAHNHDADRSIDCGGGDDTARVDRHLDPPTKNCERVILLGTSSR